MSIEILIRSPLITAVPLLLEYYTTFHNICRPYQHPYPLRNPNQIIKQPREKLNYQILPVSRINNSSAILYYFSQLRIDQINSTYYCFTFEVTVKLIGLNPHPIPTSTQTIH